MALSRERSLIARLHRWIQRRLGRRPSSRAREHAGWDQSLILSLSKGRFPSWRQIRHLPEVLSHDDGTRLRLGTFLLLVGLGLLGARFYYANSVIAPAVGGSVVEGTVGTPRSLNPILSVTNDVDADIARLVFSRLYTVDGDGRVVPELVEKSEVSADLKTYVLTVKDGVEWHDGKPLTAEDVAFTLALIQDPAWKSPLHGAFKDIGVEKRDERTIALTLKEPYAPFLSRLTFGIMPKHAWKDVSPQDSALSELNFKPLGSGPFRFGAVKRDKRGFIQSLTLERNPDYFKEAPYLEEFSFHFYPDPAAALEALKRREVDSLGFIPRDLRPTLASLAHVLPVSLELPQYTAVFFNQRKNALLKEKEIRRALAMAIDKKRILFDVLGGDGHPLDAPPLPGSSGTSTSGVIFDLDEAASMLDAAGWKLDTTDGIRKKGGEVDPKTKKAGQAVPLAVTLTTVDQAESLAVAKIIRNGWSAIGVDVTVLAIPPTEIHRTAIKTREYEALLYGQLLGADPDPYPFWHSSQVQDPGLNLAMYADREADDAIEAAQRSADPNVRQEHERRFLARLASELPAAFLYSPTYAYPLPADLKGFSGERVSNPSDRFATVTSWYLETERIWRK